MSSSSPCKCRMTAEACIAHQLECLVHPGEFVRVEQLRPGASYLIQMHSAEYFDLMSEDDQKQLVTFGWKAALLPGEWIVRGRWASAVGGGALPPPWASAAVEATLMPSPSTLMSSL